MTHFMAGNGSGETFVYNKGKLLYSIDQYISNPIYTFNNGEYLIEVDFYFYYRTPIGQVLDDGTIRTEKIKYDGDAIKIYKNGNLIKTYKISTLQIDESKLRMHQYLNSFSWNYLSSDSTSKTQREMGNHPVYLIGSELNLISCDNRIIKIDILNEQIINIDNAESKFENYPPWETNRIIRKYHKTKYPDKFSLPRLTTGQTFEQGLATYFSKFPTGENRDSALINIYIHTLLINSKGKCEDIFSSPSIRSDINVDFDNSYNKDMKEQIENWVMKQTFSTLTFPKNFTKFKYSDFVFLK